MKLTETFPNQIMVHGVPYAIRTDYRHGIRHEQMLQYRKNTTVEAALQAVDWFYRCGDTKELPKNRKKQTRLYDFDIDANVIAASFRQCYGISLHTANLHWWEFCELLNGLPEKCAFADRVQLRGFDTKGMKAKDRRKIEEQKRLYQIPDTIHTKKYRTLEERNAAMIAYVNKRFADIESR